MSWKLVGAALKAQRTWANLSPEQKEQVTRAAARAARSAYAKMQEPSPSTASRPEAGAAQPAPPASGAETASQSQPKQPAAGGHDGKGEARPEAEASPSITQALLAMARAEGPRIAQQAASVASSRAQSRAAQLAALWRRAQQRPPA